MGSIPVRSTKKHRMQFCIRCFLALFLVNSSLVRQYGKAVFLPRVSRLRETANSRIYQQKQSLQFCIRCFLILFLVNPSLVHNSEAVQQQQRKAEKYGVYYKPAYYPKIRQKQTCVLSVNRGKIISRFIGSRDIIPLLKRINHYFLKISESG